MHLCGTTKKPVSWLLLWPNGWFLCDSTQNLEVNYVTSISLQGRHCTVTLSV